jgi:hypothetical protein
VEILLVAFKIVGILMSGVLGVLSSVLKIRDASGQLTTKGKVFIAGSVAGLCIALISQILETYIQRQSQAVSQSESLESARKLQKIMFDLNRSLQPLGKFSVFVYKADVSLDDPAFDGYKKRLGKAIEIYLRKGQRERMKERDISAPFGFGQKEDGYRPSYVEVEPGGKYYPSTKDGKEISSMVFPLCYRFVFFKDPIEASDYHPMHHFGKGLGDLRADNFMPKPFPLTKDLITGAYSITGRLEFRTWEDVSGKIVSIPDLIGSQLLVSTCGKPMRSWTWQGSKKIYHNPVDTKFELGSMNIQFDKRKANISKEKLKRFERKGEVYWEYRFPTTQEGLAKLFSGS